jgi:hypothetical protein
MLRLQAVTAGRLPAGVVALALAVTVASSPAPGTAPLLAASQPPQLSLNLNLASSQELSATSTGALVAEVNAIWWDSNLSLSWRTANVSEPLPAMPEQEHWLRVLVLARQTSGAGDASTFAVGELVRSEGSRPLAIASVTAARRVVDSAGRFPSSPRLRWRGQEPDYERRLGVVLGRAVAHEIGHYLLRTGTHANQGLMRARIDAEEFADVRSRSFRLDNPAQAYLAKLAITPPSQTTPFSYSAP